MREFAEKGNRRLYSCAMQAFSKEMARGKHDHTHTADEARALGRGQAGVGSLGSSGCRYTVSRHREASARDGVGGLADDPGACRLAHAANAATGCESDTRIQQVSPGGRIQSHRRGFLPCPCWLAAQLIGDLRIAAELNNVGNGAVGVDGVVTDGGRGRNPVGSEGLCEGKSLQMLDVCEHGV